MTARRFTGMICVTMCLVFPGCSSDGPATRPAVDAEGSAAVAEIVAAGDVGLDLRAFAAEWEPLALQIGRSKGAVELDGGRLDLGAALNPAVERLPASLRPLWLDFLEDAGAAGGVEVSRLDSEKIALTLLVANDGAFATVFGEALEGDLGPRDVDLFDLGGAALQRAEASVISAIERGAADAERQRD